jgi:hypothetical protein
MATVWASYTGMQSMLVEYPFYYYPCGFLAQPQNFHGYVDGMVVTLTWDPPEGMSTADQDSINNNSRYTLTGYNVWRNDKLAAFLPDSIHEFTDTVSSPEDCSDDGYLEVFYNLTAVYTEGESCLLDPSFESIGCCPFDAPEGLTAEILEGDVALLSWNPPWNDITGEWIHWDDGENYDGIGLTYGDDFLVASRWTVTDLVAYDGMYLTKISFYPLNAATDYTLKVWTGENACTLVLDQPLGAVVLDEWNTVTLTSPVQIDATQELWFGYAVIDQPAGEHPAGCDDGPAVAGKGDMISTDGVTWDPLSGFGLDYNWNLQGYVTTEAYRYDLLGYNIYLFDEVMAFTADTFYYITPPLIPDNYSFYVSAVYDVGESCKDGPAVITACCTSGIQGLVYDATTQKPLSGITVELNPYLSMITGIDGNYGFYHINGGYLIITVEAEGYKPFSQGIELDYDKISDLDVRLVDTSVFTIPFYESWDEATFEAQRWTFSPEQIGWQISTIAGDPAPSAEFKTLEHLEDYSYSLISPYIDASNITENCTFEFDLHMNPIVTTGNEMLTVEVWKEGEWFVVREFSNDSEINWQHYQFDISDYALGKVTRVRFTAHGANSQDLDFWQIDNIRVREIIMATLQGLITDDYGNPVNGYVRVGSITDSTHCSVFYSLEIEEGTYSVTWGGAGCLEVPIFDYLISGVTILDLNLSCKLIQLNPTAIYVESEGGIETRDLTIENIGCVPLNWSAEIEYLNENHSIVNNDTVLRTEWLSLGSYSATVDSNETGIVEVYFNSDELLPGQLYEAKINLTSTPDYGVQTVDVGFMLITGIGEMDKNNLIRIYPNPSKDYVIIESEQEINQVSITNYIGLANFEKEENNVRYLKVNTSGYSNGIYLVRCRMSDSNTVIKKLVINR